MTPARRASPGLLPWVFPAILAVTALNVVLTNRDLTQGFAQLQVIAEPVRPAAVAWLQRGVSLLLLLAAVEQIANHLALRLRTPSALLLGTFLAYWAGSTGLPAFLGANPQVSHELLYALGAGTAACLASPSERDRILALARDTLFVLMLAGVALVPLRLHMVLDTTYAEGLLRGLPRFGGLAAHPVSQGMMAQVALLLLLARPYRRRSLRLAAWVLGLGVLVMAQSKTAWFAFLLSGGAMAWARHGRAFQARLADPRRSGFGVAVSALAALAVVAVAATLLFADVAGRFGAFLASDQGAQLVSLTGRDRIWAAAAQEWAAHPVFGYGLSLWDAAYRASIGLPQATHAHNQFMDDAARAGTVGAVALVAYAGVLLALSLRQARASAGLSVALFLAIALRAISEVPLGLQGYDPELFTHLLLLVTLAGASATASAPAPASTPAPGTPPAPRLRPLSLRHGGAG